MQREEMEGARTVGENLIRRERGTYRKRAKERRDP